MKNLYAWLRQRSIVTNMFWQSRATDSNLATRAPQVSLELLRNRAREVAAPCACNQYIYLADRRARKIDIDSVISFNSEYRQDIISHGGVDRGVGGLLLLPFCLKALSSVHRLVQPIDMTMEHSYAEAHLAFSTDIPLRAEYVTFVGNTIRVGKLLEDLVSQRRSTIVCSPCHLLAENGRMTSDPHRCPGRGPR